MYIHLKKQPGTGVFLSVKHDLLPKLEVLGTNLLRLKALMMRATTDRLSDDWLLILKLYDRSNGCAWIYYFELIFPLLFTA